MSSKKSSNKDKKAAGAEHVKKTLEALKGTGQKKYMGANNDDFLVNMEFRNNLPAVPCGPYLSKIDMTGMYAKLRNKTESSLERSYVWQRHCPLDMNVAIRLEDQESVLGNQEGSAPQRYNAIVGPESYQLSSAADKSKQQQKNEHVAANWWLRETRYGENQLFKDSNKKSMEVQAAVVDEHYYDKEVIEGSFKKIVEHDDADDVEWSLPILPDDNYGEQDYSFTRFDEDPEKGETWEKHAEEEEAETAKHAVGQKRMRESILTNIRDSNKINTYAVSMVVPTLDSEGPKAVGDSADYSWAADFSMNLNTSAKANYLFVVNHDGKSVKYHNVNALIDMHILNIDEIKPHNANVTIVPPLEEDDN